VSGTGARTPERERERDGRREKPGALARASPRHPIARSNPHPRVHSQPHLLPLSPPVTLAAAFLGLLLVTSEVGEFRHPAIEQTVSEERERERWPHPASTTSSLFGTCTLTLLSLFAAHRRHPAPGPDAPGLQRHFSRNAVRRYASGEWREKREPCARAPSPTPIPLSFPFLNFSPARRHGGRVRRARLRRRPPSYTGRPLLRLPARTGRRAPPVPPVRVRRAGGGGRVPSPAD